MQDEGKKDNIHEGNRLVEHVNVKPGSEIKKNDKSDVQPTHHLSRYHLTLDKTGQTGQ